MKENFEKDPEFVDNEVGRKVQAAIFLSYSDSRLGHKIVGAATEEKFLGTGLRGGGHGSCNFPGSSRRESESFGAR